MEYYEASFEVSCEIHTFTIAEAPTGTQTYYIRDTALFVSLASVRYVQVPSCGYGISNAFTYTYSIGAKPSYITEGVETPGITIYSTTESDAGSVFNVEVTNAIEVLNAAQTGSTSFTKTFTLSVQLINPCTAANAVL